MADAGQPQYDSNNKEALAPGEIAAQRKVDVWWSAMTEKEQKDWLTKMYQQEERYKDFSESLQKQHEEEATGSLAQRVASSGVLFSQADVRKSSRSEDAIVKAMKDSAVVRRLFSNDATPAEVNEALMVVWQDLKARVPDSDVRLAALVRLVHMAPTLAYEATALSALQEGDVNSREEQVVALLDMKARALSVTASLQAKLSAPQQQPGETVPLYLNRMRLMAARLHGIAQTMNAGVTPTVAMPNGATLWRGLNANTSALLTPVMGTALDAAMRDTEKADTRTLLLSALNLRATGCGLDAALGLLEFTAACVVILKAATLAPHAVERSTYAPLAVVAQPDSLAAIGRAGTAVTSTSRFSGRCNWCTILGHKEAECRKKQAYKKRTKAKDKNDNNDTPAPSAPLAAAVAAAAAAAPVNVTPAVNGQAPVASEKNT